MTHAAKKISAGSYEYRGYTIRKGETTWGEAAWFIDKDWDTYGPSSLDYTAALRDAKASIDIALSA
jgi:hypothetical protein